MKKIKCAVIGFVFCLLSSARVFAAGYPVIDIANLLQAIDQLYATYDEITSAIETVQNTYQQLQASYTAMSQMNWDNLSSVMSDHNGIPDIRDPIKSAMKRVNYNMNLVNNVKDTLTKKTIKFGNKNYTFGGLFGFGKDKSDTTIFDLPKNMVDYVMETRDSVLAGYEDKLTPAQRNKIMNRYGVSARNYATIKMVEEVSSELMDDMLTVGTDEHVETVLKEVEEQNGVILAMMDNAGESTNAHLETNIMALVNLNQSIANMKAGFDRYISFAAMKDGQEKTMNEATARDREIVELQKKSDNLHSSKISPGY